MSAKPAPWVTTHRVTLPCYDGDDQISAPPERVLEVCVVADRAFLALCDYDEDSETTTTREVSEAHVDAMALLNALIAQMGLERVRLALPFPEVTA